jgi:hypothetical protein
LTGTPVYNLPSDVAGLLNTAVGKKVLPSDPEEFKRLFLADIPVHAPLLAKIRGTLTGHDLENVSRQELINRRLLVNAAKGYVDVHQGGGAEFPERSDEHHSVEMSPLQHEMYEFHTNKMPWYLQAKIRAGLPLNKAEAQNMNAFQTALRQVSNTPRPYREGMTDEEEEGHTPKIQLMARHLREMRDKDPNFRGIVYSTYLGAGLNPMSRALQKHNIPHNVFTGEVPKKQRDQMVLDYNSGKVPVLLVSGAGAEGLDLKGTKAIQIMEPHWNESRINQVIGRGIRYQSHAHLPEHERKVKVLRYTTVLPKSFLERKGLSTPAQGVEEYIHNTAKDKERVSNQIADALTEASNYGALKKMEFHGVKAAAFDETLRVFGLEKAAGAARQLRQILSEHAAGAATGAGLGAGIGGIYAHDTVDPTESFEAAQLRRLKGMLIGGVLGGVAGGAVSGLARANYPRLFHRVTEGPYPEEPSSFLQKAHGVYMHPATRGLLGLATGTAIANKYRDLSAEHRFGQLAALKALGNEDEEKQKILDARLEALKASRHMGEYRSSLDK